MTVRSRLVTRPQAEQHGENDREHAEVVKCLGRCDLAENPDAAVAAEPDV